MAAKRNEIVRNDIWLTSRKDKISETLPWLQGSWGQQGANLGPVGPRWAPCRPHEPCYLGSYFIQWDWESLRSCTRVSPVVAPEEIRCAEWTVRVGAGKKSFKTHGVIHIIRQYNSSSLVPITVCCPSVANPLSESMSVHFTETSEITFSEILISKK